MVISHISKISLEPSAVALNEIKDWLIKEDLKNGDGFYCNWHLIEKSIENKHIAVLLVNNKAIGFVTWRSYDDFNAIVDIMEIKPSHRKKGFGKELISYLLDHFIQNNIYVTELQCAPASSEKIWRKFGFIDFPEDNDTTNWNRGNKKLYKILIDSAEKIIHAEFKESIHLWNNEPYRTDKTAPFVSFGLNFINGTRNLLKPIIYPCNRNWRLQWIIDNVTIKDDKIKYCFKDEFVFGNFLIIKNLPEKI